jgi:hypothetical protein
MGRKTVKQISALLVEFGAATEEFTAGTLRKHNAGDGVKIPMETGFGLSDETYGRDSRLYVHGYDTAGSSGIAKAVQLAAFLREHGVEPKPYGVPSTVEVGVLWFKGWHWDE